jgi:HEAT repeat protein
MRPLLRDTSWAGLVAAVLFALIPGRTTADEVIDSPMYLSPALPSPRIERVLVDARDLWLKALERPEAEMCCRAADAIASGRRVGLKGLEATVPRLRAVLARPGLHPSARLAVVRALVTLEARDVAPDLFRLAQEGDGDLREVIEPALAKWDYRPAREVWLARLRESQPAVPALLLAVRALGTTREAQAADKLAEFVSSDRIAGAIRLEAAKALGSLRTEGLEKEAARLAEDTSAQAETAHLAAAMLLHAHRSAEAVGILQRLSLDSSPAVAARAVGRLLEIDVKHVAAALDRLRASPDAGLRMLAVEFLFREPDAAHVRLLADRLDDTDPGVRVKARHALKELAATKGLRDPVIEGASRFLAADGWRGQEQAAILLAQLDHKPAAGRLVELLRAGRWEVFLTAAWGLRSLEVPETLPAVTSYVQEQQRRNRTGVVKPSTALVYYDHQLSQLNQLLGRRKYQPAEVLLRQFVPRSPGVGVAWPECRAAAVWALGHLHEGKADPELVAALEERLNDAIPAVNKAPENPMVRRMAAVALGLMNAKSAIASLRRHHDTSKFYLDPVSNACGWAIARLTGEVMPPPVAVTRKVLIGGFLSPDQ